ncbi:Double-stranded RNA-binding protein, partial [Corchorus capsularis]
MGRNYMHFALSCFIFFSRVQFLSSFCNEVVGSVDPKESEKKGKGRQSESEMNKGGLPEHLLHKNRLQEYAQKAGLQHPVYQTSSQGFPHAPKFRASVRVNQTTYTSSLTFPHKKEAEQNVAKIALDTIKQAAIKDKPSFSTIYEDPNSCKSILLEFAVKTNHRCPRYTTIQQNKLHPVYVSSLVFNGKTYAGEVAGSKKEAEQLVARIAIESLLEILLQIINSKNRTYPEPEVRTVNESINQSNAQKPVSAGPSEQPNGGQKSSIVNLTSAVQSAIANQKNKRKLE